MTRTPNVADIDRTIDLNIFLVRHYWRERSVIPFAGACLMHVRLVWLRAQVVLVEADRERMQ